jgi:hypothetical protein
MPSEASDVANLGYCRASQTLLLIQIEVIEVRSPEVLGYRKPGRLFYFCSLEEYWLAPVGLAL